MPARLSNEEAVHRLSTANPDLNFSKTVYRGATFRIEFDCPIHGARVGFYQSVLSSGCAECNKEIRQKEGKDTKHDGLRKHVYTVKDKVRKKWETWKSTVADVTLDFSKAVYVNTSTKVHLRCIKHDQWFLGNPKTLVRGATPNCSKCVKEKIEESRSKDARTDEEKLELMNKVHNNEYQYKLPLPHLAHEQMTIYCKKHGEFEQSFHNHMWLKTRCPVCAKTVSKGELSLRQFVQSITQEKVVKDRTVIYPKEIDIFIPAKKIGIEFHGSHYHAGQHIDHKRKYHLCLEKGIRLIQIFDDEWTNKRPIVEDLIKSALGLRNKIYARNTVFCGITNEEAVEFLNKWHINGNSPAKYKFGLKTDTGELVAVLTLSKPRFDKIYDFEIVRYATSLNIVGGFEKLFKNSVSMLSAKSIVTYADLRFGTGDTYARAGFTLLKITDPDYWWWKPHTGRVTRYQAQKHRLSTDQRFAKFYADDKTEIEICEAAGYRMVVGVGHKKFLWQFTV